ncbi:hypothetical protein [Flavobacterium ginsengiterrae]
MVKKTKIGRNSHIVFWYKSGQPSLMCKKEFALQNIDTAYWKTPGKRFMFGANIINGRVNLSFGDLLIYDGNDIINALI